MEFVYFQEIIEAHLHVHVVGGDELGAAEEHGDPEEQHNLQLPAAIVAHYLGRVMVMSLPLNTLTSVSTSW